MPVFTDFVSYQTASGILDSNIPNDEDQLYLVRRSLMQAVQNQAWGAITPYSDWIQANRVFFTLSAPLTYTIGNKNFSLAAATIYCMNPQEQTFVQKEADRLGIIVTPSTMGAWQGVGALDVFYW